MPILSSDGSCVFHECNFCTVSAVSACKAWLEVSEAPYLKYLSEHVCLHNDDKATYKTSVRG